MYRISISAVRRLLCLLTTLPAFAPVLAQTADDVVLDEIVVTATCMQSSVRDVPRSISVVNKDRIQNGTQQLGLDEALAGVPGLYMPESLQLCAGPADIIARIRRAFELRHSRYQDNSGRNPRDIAGWPGWRRQH